MQQLNLRAKVNTRTEHAGIANSFVHIKEFYSSCACKRPYLRKI